MTTTPAINHPLSKSEAESLQLALLHPGMQDRFVVHLLDSAGWHCSLAEALRRFAKNHEIELQP